MKNICALMLSAFFLALLLTSCGTTGRESKITDIPATTNSPEALAAFREGLVFSDQGDEEKAREKFTEAIGYDPEMGIAYIMRATSSNSAKEFADDVAAGKANIDSASSWEKLYAELVGTFMTGDRERATEVVHKIASEYPDAARAQVLLGNNFGGDNQADKSRQYYDKAVELDPKWIGGYAALTGSYLFADPLDLNKAELNARKMVELAPQSAGAQITLGDCYRGQNNLEKAKEAYAKAVPLNSTNAEAYLKLGHANSYLGNLEEARKNYAEAAKYDDKNSSAIQFTAYTYLYADDSKSASKYILDQLAGQNQMDASRKNECLVTVAEIALHTGDVATLKNAVEMMKPLNQQVLADLGNTDEIRLFNRADSLSWLARVNIAEAKYEMAKNNLANMKSVLDPIKDNRKLQGFEYDMGLLAMQQKNFGDAILHFEKSNPFSVYNKYMLAKANDGAGNQEKAKALYKEVAAYNFNNVGNALVRNEVKEKIGTL